MAWTSTTPAAIDALVGALRGSTALAGVAVYDGPVVTDATALEAVSVGYTDDAAPSAVEGTLAVEGVSVSPQREQYTLQCGLWVLNGGGDIAAARGRAYTLLAGVAGVLATDPRLGGAVMLARLGTVTLTQSQTQKGAVAQLVFGVEVDAYSER